MSEDHESHGDQTTEQVRARMRTAFGVHAWQPNLYQSVPGDRTRVLAVVSRRAMLLGKRLYGFDDEGHTYEVRIARRDAFRRSDGVRTRVKGTIYCPKTTMYLCIEGDELWTRLPGSVSVAEAKAMESARQKLARVRKAPAQSAAYH